MMMDMMDEYDDGYDDINNIGIEWVYVIKISQNTWIYHYFF